MFVPGATRSGLVRLSIVGPREENAAMPSALSETWPAGPSFGHVLVPEPGSIHSLQLMSIPGVGVEPCGRLFSLAPTVRQFFAVPGEPTEPASMTPSAG